ncbi:Alpha/Beta hydrolase protein [Colletotrichum cereale]|nr:Alpha/Beta hydrolase protein [Colletotrichum cereale]
MSVERFTPATSLIPHQPWDEKRKNSQPKYHIGASKGLSKTQKVILDCLAQTGRVTLDVKVEPDTDLIDILQNSGLDSSQMLIFKAALEQRISLPAPIPVTTLINAQTLQVLENEILKITVSNTTQLLLPFASEGERTPLFLFPPGGGELHCWLELVHHLPNRPIYGLRLRGLQKGETAFESMAEAVSCFLEEICRVQPCGPYALLGMCFGGNIAYEVARELEAKGEVVSFVGGIDNAPYIPEMSFAALRFFTIDLLASRRLITADEQKNLKKELSEAEPATFPRLITRRFRTRLEAAGVTLERLEAWQRVFHGTVQIGKAYEPKGKIATYTSFWASPLSEWNISKKDWESRVRGWETLSAESSFHFIGGNHYSALTRDHINEFQKVLNRELELHGI